MKRTLVGYDISDGPMPAQERIVCLRCAQGHDAYELGPPIYDSDDIVEPTCCRCGSTLLYDYYAGCLLCDQNRPLPDPTRIPSGTHAIYVSNGERVTYIACNARWIQVWPPIKEDAC